MADLAVYTRLDPKQRIERYNNFINRILTTPKVNIVIEILMSK